MTSAFQSSVSSSRSRLPSSVTDREEKLSASTSRAAPRILESPTTSITCSSSRRMSGSEIPLVSSMSSFSRDSDLSSSCPTAVETSIWSSQCTPPLRSRPRLMPSSAIQGLARRSSGV